MKAPERATMENAPAEIIGLLMFPYAYFGGLFDGAGLTLLDIGAKRETKGDTW
jgi:hypothetical protein